MPYHVEVPGAPLVANCYLGDAAYTEMGVGFAVNPQDEAGVYWALEFGRPRPP